MDRKEQEIMDRIKDRGRRDKGSGQFEPGSC